ncbi:protein RFT1 homolog [Drosophila madeirensis]|uniref:Protein RFT1 homolog n=1 Tax=Drosophila madeirensis TaxID=30013 RepID=A0AAU9FYU5_DROMD
MLHNWEEVNKHMEDFPFTRLSEFLPGVMYDPIGKFFNRELQTLTLSFVKQGVLKQILTEGEKYVMSVSPVLSFGEQATYDVVNNLGSMAARFIFRPIEDSSYFYFTQSISRDTRLAKQPQEQLNNLLLGVSSSRESWTDKKNMFSVFYGLCTVRTKRIRLAFKYM